MPPSASSSPRPLQNIHQTIHSNLSTSSPAGSAEIESCMLHCTVDEKREVLSVQVYALVELEIEGQVESGIGNSGKGKAKSKGKGKEERTGIDEDGEESGESIQCKTVLCLWEGRISLSDLSPSLSLSQLRTSILLGRLHVQLKKKNKTKTHRRETSKTGEVEMGRLGVLRGLEEITIVFNHNSSSPQLISLILTSPSLSPSSLTSSNATKPNERTSQSNNDDSETEQTGNERDQGEVALQGMMSCWMEVVGRMNKAEDSAEKYAQGKRDEEETGGPPAKRSRPNSHSPTPSPCNSQSQPWTAKPTPALPNPTLTSENIALRHRIRELERSNRINKRNVANLVSGGNVTDLQNGEGERGGRGGGGTGGGGRVRGGNGMGMGGKGSLLQPGMKSGKKIETGFVGSDDEDDD